MTRHIRHIVIHCSATRQGRDVRASDVDAWHRAKGWRCIGYHYFIRLDGTIERGRPEHEVGAHVAGHNAASIGVCYAGGYDDRGRPADTRTEAQRKAMAQLVGELLARYSTAVVCGHRDFPEVNKACPCFDVGRWWLESTVPVLVDEVA